MEYFPCQTKKRQRPEWALPEGLLAAEELLDAAAYEAHCAEEG